MKTALFSIMTLLAATTANAQTIVLKGNAAEDFIRKFFPGAPIPGAFTGTVKCNVPAMGGRGNGEISICKLTD